MNSVEIANELKELLNGGNINVQLSVPQLAEKATSRGEAMLTVDGAVRAETGKYTGRSPKDKYTVEEESTKDQIDWGKVNQPISSEVFDNLYVKVIKYLKERDELFVFKGFAGADKDSQLSIQVINEYAWHNLFAHQLFIRPTADELASHVADFTVISAPNFKADPAVDGTASETFIIVSLEKKIILIGGTEYAGEMKKSIFGIMNYLLPQQGILSMHCSANVGEAGDVALFFGLSGTGKTTLSADPDRKLIGDDEHGWSDNGVFNIEGGCYAKTINLSAEKEPEIYNAIRFGSVLENVAVDPETRICDYDDGSLTENTRVAYPIQYIENIVDPSVAGHPKTIIFLTADAFGVLPPISKLTKEQEMLGQKIDEHGAQVYLVNTGWTGGEYGTGSRMKLSYTRTMVRAAIDGKLADVETTQDAVFGLHIPTAVEGVPSEVLNPREAWADKAAYDAKAAELAGLFNENFKKFSNVSEAITTLGGPLK